MSTRVLAIVTNPSLGGAEQVLLDAIDACVSDPVDFHVVLPGFGPLVGELQARGVEHTVLSFGDSLSSMGRNQRSSFSKLFGGVLDTARYVIRLRRLIQSLRADLVYTHGIKAHFLSAPAMIGNRKRLIWHIHVFPPRGVVGLALRMASLRCTQMIANSRAVAKSVARTFSNPTTVVYCPILPERYRAVAKTVARRELGLAEFSEGRILVGIVSVLAPWKGVDVFLRSIAPLLQAHENLRAIICGGVLYQTSGHSAYDRELESLAQRLGIEEKIRFIPFQRDPSRVYSSLDLVVHASKQPEPFGRVISEARLCGAPVLGTAAGGVLEQISDGETGWTVPMNDVHGMTKKVETILADRTGRIEVAKKGQEWVEQNLSATKFRTDLLAVFDSVLGTDLAAKPVAFSQSETELRPAK